MILEFRSSMDRIRHRLKTTKERTQVFLQNVGQRDKGMENMSKRQQDMRNRSGSNTYPLSVSEGENERERGNIPRDNG